MSSETEVPKKIDLVGRKITNPYYKTDQDRYLGCVRDYKFSDYYQKQYHQLEQSFAEAGIIMNYMYACKAPIGKPTWLVTTNKPHIFWHKNESGSSVSAFNKVLVNGVKFGIPEWKRLTKEQKMYAALGKNPYDAPKMDSGEDPSN